MLQRDYIMRLIAEFFKTLERLLLKREPEKRREALEDMYRQYVGDYSFFHTADIDSIMHEMERFAADERIYRLEMLASFEPQFRWFYKWWVQLFAESEAVRLKVRLASQAGAEFSACLSCAVNMGTKQALEEENIEVIRWGEKLSLLMQNGKHVLTV